MSLIKIPTLEPLVEKNLYPFKPESADVRLSEEENRQLMEFLKNNKDIFTWPYIDMLDIHSRIACHILDL